MCDLKNVKINLKDSDCRKEIFDYLEQHGYKWNSGHTFRQIVTPDHYLFINGQKRVTKDFFGTYFNSHPYTEVFFYDGAFHYENEQTKNDEGKEKMTTEINYTRDWYIDCPNTEEEWEIFVKIMEHFGVSLFSKQYELGWPHISCSREYPRVVCASLGFEDHHVLNKVTLLEAITLLQRPVKTEQQLKIEELEATIAKAQEQIKELKSKHM